MRKTRATKQKELLEVSLKRMRSVFTAKEFQAEANKQDAAIGIATVYRFLGEAGSKERVHAFTCNRKRIYTTNTHSHCHFICTHCNTTTHFSLEKADFLESLPGDACHLQLDVHGICKKCLASKI